MSIILGGLYVTLFVKWVVVVSEETRDSEKTKQNMGHTPLIMDEVSITISKLLTQNRKGAEQMIFAKNTPSNTGIALYGDFIDFENFYEALHDVVGDEDELIECFSARIRAFGVCYDIRHALMGDREYEFVDNGLDEEKKRRMSVLAPDKNVYLKIYVLWPEMLFVMIALNDFLQLYAGKRAKTKYTSNWYTHAKVSRDHTVVQVRMFLAAVAECLKQTLSEATYARL